MAHENQDALTRNRVCDSIDVRVQEGDERPFPRDPESHSVIVLYLFYDFVLLHVRFQQKPQTTFLLYAERDENVKNKT